MNPTFFQQHFDSIRSCFALIETEETWDTIASGITALASSCSDTESYTSAELVTVVRSISRPLVSAMNSERSRLSGVAIDLVGLVASCLGVAFDPLLAHFFPVLLALSSRASKVTVARARSCILTIIETTHLPSLLSYLTQSITDKSVPLRLTIVESTLACLNCFNPPDLERDTRAKEIELIIRSTARDASADVRKVSRKIFEAYQLLLPSRVENFIAPLTPTTRKYLDIKSKIADKSKPSHTHLPAPSKAAQLSSSTSAMRGPSSRRPPAHTRSASSPAVGPDIAVAATNNKPLLLKSIKAEMVPQNLPEAVPPSRQHLVAESTTAIERKRVVSMFAAVRPVVSSSQVGEGGQPTSDHPARRPQHVNNAAKATAVVARRVAIADVQPEKTFRAPPRIDNSTSTPSIRHVSTTTSGKPIAPVAPRVASQKTGAPAKKEVAKQSKEPVKSSYTQPTLSHISRAKTIQRPVPGSVGSRPLPGKTFSSKAHLPARKVKQPNPPIPGVGEVASTLFPVDREPQDVEVDKDDVSEQDQDHLSGTPAPKPDLEGRIQKSPETKPNIMVTPNPLDPATPPKADGGLNAAMSKTPISELLLSIERGFIFSPSAPLSPPQSYLDLDLAIPFPVQTIWPSSEPQDEDSGNIVHKPSDRVRRLESRRALGYVGINK
ncbi:clasp N terminal-domain-containing protein [Mycena pura]|uniref:Clasp N terminal-domain-containing protein n=1 Tax=Mycena pura TaxID=153505 RepID=A0AAD6VE47_9AGAR|nr:clasp N terminal-domain-containing protein [Mycena pura]